MTIEWLWLALNSEIKMGEFDRNKLFCILTEICACSALLNDPSHQVVIPVSENLLEHKDPHEGERIQKSDIILSDGSEYTGETLNDIPDGQGVRVWSKPEHEPGTKLSNFKLRYEGEFKKGRAHGSGKCKFANGSSYEGMWKNDEKNGEGKQINKKGIVLNGRWVNGSLEGKGKEVWPNGDVYEGDFSMGK